MYTPALTLILILTLIGTAGSPPRGPPRFSSCPPEANQTRMSHQTGAAKHSRTSHQGADLQTAGGRPYTQEQANLVQHILRTTRTREYYNILRIPMGATADQVQRAYRKLVKNLHPDKNCAPGAEEAFKKVNKVVQSLTNPRATRTQRFYS